MIQDGSVPLAVASGDHFQRAAAAGHVAHRTSKLSTGSADGPSAMSEAN